MDRPALLNEMIAAALAAGQVVDEVYSRTVKAEIESDGSPLMEADTRSVLGVVLAPAPNRLFVGGPDGAREYAVEAGASWDTARSRPDLSTIILPRRAKSRSPARPQI